MPEKLRGKYFESVGVKKTDDVKKHRPFFLKMVTNYFFCAP